MKTKILTFALIALMTGMTLNSNASNDDSLKVVNSVSTEFQACINQFPDNIVRFQLVKPDEDKVKLRVYSEKGRIIYTYSLKKHNKAKISFDVSYLEPGKYDYVVERNKEEVIRKTIIKDK
jgi:flagellar hook assembly protein FlgD